MVTFFTVTLAVSLVGLISLLLVKRLEIMTGRVMLRRLRANNFFHTFFVFMERVLPTTIRYCIVMSARFVRTRVQRVVAWIILHIERKLERVLHTVRERTTPPPGKGEVSSFLRAVADHKTKLLHSAPMDRAIFDE